MSQLDDTKRAHVALSRLLDRAVLKAGAQGAKDLERFRATLDVAFYLLGWAQFEYLVRKASVEVLDEHIGQKGVERHAWLYMKENIKSVTVRQRLELIFNGNQQVLNSLLKDYSARNEIAHNYKRLPPGVNDLDEWLEHLEKLVDKF